jgi:hypothetical protein
MNTAQFWSNLTAFAAFLDGDGATRDRTLSELEKEQRNSAPEHRKRISDELETVVAQLAELKTRTADVVPPTLVAGDTAHAAEKDLRD